MCCLFFERMIPFRKQINHFLPVCHNRLQVLQRFQRSRLGNPGLLLDTVLRITPRNLFSISDSTCAFGTLLNHASGQAMVIMPIRAPYHNISLLIPSNLPATDSPLVRVDRRSRYFHRIHHNIALHKHHRRSLPVFCWCRWSVRPRFAPVLRSGFWRTIPRFGLLGEIQHDHRFILGFPNRFNRLNHPRHS